MVARWAHNPKVVGSSPIPATNLNQLLLKTTYMAKLGKIAVIPRDFSSAGIQTMQSELSRNGMSRIPGTGVFKYPYKEIDGKYRTGLDVDAAYIRRIEDPTERELEIERITALKKRLQYALGDIDLGPRASFWNYGLSLSTDDQSHVQPVKLLDGDNYFDCNIPFQELAFSWLRVHPTIASSFQAWERGEYPADTQYFVADDEIENAIVFKKKQAINKAIAKFDGMTPEKKRKVARLLGLPVSDETSESVIYNSVDNILKEINFKKGTFKGQSTIDMFNRFAGMKENLLHIKDLVSQALTHSIYRLKPNGKIYEGEFEIAKDEADLVKFLADDNNQDELLTLEGKLKIKKIAAV